MTFRFDLLSHYPPRDFNRLASIEHRPELLLARLQGPPGSHQGRRQGWLGELSAQFTARGAIHPMQAMLNYVVGVLAARMTRVVVARGLDASFGFLHDGRKPGRLSLVWDCVEVFRPGLVTAVFGLADGRTFKKSELGLFSKETIGLLPPLARDVAEVSIAATPLRDMVKAVDWLARLL